MSTHFHETFFLTHFFTESGLMIIRKASGVNEAADNKSKSGTKAVHVALDMDSAVLLVSKGSSTRSDVSSHYNKIK